MKKTILILMCVITSSVISQTTFTTDVTATKSTGVTTILSNTNDNSGYAVITTQAGPVNASIVSFGTSGGVGTLYDNSTSWFSCTAPLCGIINEQSNGKIVFATGGYGQTKECMRIEPTGITICVGGPTYPITPSAHLTIGAGGTSAGSAPMSIKPGQLLTVPQACTLEVDSNGDLYWTNSAGTRVKIN